MVLAVVGLALLPPAPAMAQSGDRTLYLYYTHTRETARITFRRNGHYDQAGLRELNYFLRDWRRDEPTEMDPALFDLIWTVYQEVGATEPINIVSAYRAPATNEMLRANSSGVAENSQHTHGKAMDFFIPGIPISKLRKVAMRHQVGGVGYYPTSGSPFVHLDTGNVRAWPRMTRAQLQNLFPEGRTLHLPAEGNTPLSADGRRYAMAEWQRCKSVPCANGTANTQVTGGGNGRNLLDMLLGNGSDEVDNVQVASNTRQRAASPAPIVAPTPAPRASFLDARNPQVAPIPVEMPETIMIATHHVTPEADNDATGNGNQTASDVAEELGTFNTALDDFAVASIDVGDAPTPRALLSRDQGDLPVVTSYAPANDPEPDAQRALQMLIERRNSTALTAPEPELRGSVQTASLGAAPQISLDQAASLFASTWNAVQNATSGSAQPAAEQLAASTPEYDLVNMPARNTHFVAPDLDHIQETFVTPVSLTHARFGAMETPVSGDFSPATELGVHCKSMTFSTGTQAPGTSDRFAAQQPLFVATL